jgi:hypothetical protein
MWSSRPSYRGSPRRSSASSGIVPRFSPNPARFDNKAASGVVNKGTPPTRQERRPLELTDPVKRILDNYEGDRIIKIYQGKD